MTGNSYARAAAKLRWWQVSFSVFRLFVGHPEVRSRYFPKMDVKDLKVLSAHGAKIMKDVDTLVNYVNDCNDEKLVQKIHMVKMGCYGHFNHTFI